MSNGNMEELTTDESPEETNDRMIKEICQALILDKEKLQQIKDVFLNDLKLGLCKYSHTKAMAQWAVTYIQDLPGGCENGSLLALDWSGVNFRIMAIYLKCKKDFHMDSKLYEIPTKLLTGLGGDLFDFLAESLSTFVKTFQVNGGDESLPLALNFGFEIKQTAINKAELVSWQGGIDCPDVVGRDMIQMLRDALERRDDVKIQILILVKDPIGTLMNGAWQDRNCKIGLNVAPANCKACYMEKIINMTIYENPKGNTTPTMLINCVWGLLGDNGKLDFLQSKYDKDIDERSENPKGNVFEKLLIDKHLGELVRLILMDCINAELLFKGNVSEQLRQEASFKSEYIFLIENENHESYDIIREILEKLGYKNPSNFDCEQTRYICHVVMKRSADLLAAIIACLIDRVGDPYTMIAIDGTLCHQFPPYNCLMSQRISQLVRPEHKFKLMLSEDGSGRGAALTAAVIVSKCHAEMLKMQIVTRSSTRKSSNGGSKRPTGNLY